MPFTIMETDLYIAAGVALIPVGIAAAGIKYWYDIRQNAPEANLFRAARKYLHPPPLMRIADTDGNGFLALGEVDKKGDVIFRFSEAGGVQVNPRMQGVVPEDRINGIPFYNYSTQFPFPLSARNTQAFRAILDYTRKKYPEVKFITDLRLLELVALPANELFHDCTNVIETMEQSIAVPTVGGTGIINKAKSLKESLALKLGLSKEEEAIVAAEADEIVSDGNRPITVEELVTIIKQIQAESHVLPINKGYFSYNWAFERVPSSILAQDIYQIKLLVKKQLSFDILNEYSKYIPLAFAVLIIVVAAGLGWSMMK